MCFVLFQALQDEVDSYRSQVRAADKKLQRRELETHEQVPAAAPPPSSSLGQGGSMVKNNTLLQSESTYFSAKFSASFLLCFLGNKRELNCLNPTGKHLSRALYFKLVFQLF